MTLRTIWLGAVAYDAKVVPIWEGMRRYFRDEAHLDVEVILFQTYEAQVRALLAAVLELHLPDERVVDEVRENGLERLAGNGRGSRVLRVPAPLGQVGRRRSQDGHREHEGRGKAEGPWSEPFSGKSCWPHHAGAS